jgi:hypothetical protein
MAEFIITDKTLKPADSYRLPFLAENAVAFALAFLRTDPAADGRKVVLHLHPFYSLDHITFAQCFDKLGDQDTYRASLDAFGILALEAALCFCNCCFRGISESNFFKVATAEMLVLIRHFVSLYLNAFCRYQFSHYSFPLTLVPSILHLC